MEQKADSSPTRTEARRRMKALSILFLMCAAASNAVPVHSEHDSQGDNAKLVQVTTLSITEIY